MVGTISIKSDVIPHFKTSNGHYGLTPGEFECSAFIHVHNQYKGKLDPQAIKCASLLLVYSKGIQVLQPFIQKILRLCIYHLCWKYIFFFFSKSHLQEGISIVENGTYESFEPLKPLVFLMFFLML